MAKKKKTAKAELSEDQKAKVDQRKHYADQAARKDAPYATKVDPKEHPSFGE